MDLLTQLRTEPEFILDELSHSPEWTATNVQGIFSKFFFSGFICFLINLRHIPPRSDQYNLFKDYTNDHCKLDFFIYYSTLLN